MLWNFLVSLTLLFHSFQNMLPNFGSFKGLEDAAMHTVLFPLYHFVFIFKMGLVTRNFVSGSSFLYLKIYYYKFIWTTNKTNFKFYLWVHTNDVAVYLGKQSPKPFSTKGFPSGRGQNHYLRISDLISCLDSTKLISS